MRDFREENFYELLDVHPKANQQELESSYRRARKIFSPDSVATYALFQPDELNLLRRRIEEAFRTLSDPTRRSAYDQELLKFENSWIEVVKSEPNPDATEQQQQLEQSAPSSVSTNGQDGQPGSFEHVGSAEQSTVEGGEDVYVEPEPQTSYESEQPQPIENLDELESDPQNNEPDGEPVEQSVSSGSDGSVSDLEQEIDEIPTAQMPVVDESTEITGALLKQAREVKGLTLDDYVEKTKISIYYLRNIENEDFKDLPAPVYVRGYLQQLAKILGLDPVLVTKGYMERMNKED